MFVYFFIHSICTLQSSAQGKERLKKQEAETYYLFIVYMALALSLFLYGLSPLNTHPTKVFRATSEKRAKLFVCLISYTATQPSKLCLKAKKDEKARNCDLLSKYCHSTLSTYCLQLHPSHYLYMVSSLQTHALPRALSNHVFVFFYTQPSKLCSRQRRMKSRKLIHCLYLQSSNYYLCVSVNSSKASKPWPNESSPRVLRTSVVLYY